MLVAGLYSLKSGSVLNAVQCFCRPGVFVSERMDLVYLNVTQNILVSMLAHYNCFCSIKQDISALTGFIYIYI